MSSAGDVIELEGKVVKLEKSLIPNVVIANVECSSCFVKFDLTKQLLVFEEGDVIKLTISKEKPEYEFGKDFVGWGHVVGIKKGEGGKLKLLISLWGYLFVIESSDNSLISRFSPMDKVYIKISKKQ